MSVQGSLSASSAGKKDRTWIWVLGLFLVLCLSLVVGCTAVYIFMLRPSGGVPLPPAQDVPMPSVVATETRPALPEPTAVPVLLLPEALVVEPYLPGVTYTFELGYIVPDYFPVFSAPEVREWEADIQAWETVMMDQYWCTATADVLEQNFEHIEYIWEVDGELVDMESMYIYQNESDTDPPGVFVCQGYIGIIRAWPPGVHTIIRTMSVDEVINNGWNDFPAGDYVERFTITATP